MGPPRFENINAENNQGEVGVPKNRVHHIITSRGEGPSQFFHAEGMITRVVRKTQRLENEKRRPNAWAESGSVPKLTAIPGLGQEPPDGGDRAGGGHPDHPAGRGAITSGTEPAIPRKTLSAKSISCRAMAPRIKKKAETAVTTQNGKPTVKVTK